MTKKSEKGKVQIQMMTLMMVRITPHTPPPESEGGG